MYIPDLFALNPLEFTTTDSVKSPSSASVALTADIKSNSSLILIDSFLPIVNSGLELFVLNLGLAITAWSELIPFPPSYTSMLNVSTPSTGTFTYTISSACFITFVVASVFPSPTILNVILELF